MLDQDGKLECQIEGRRQDLLKATNHEDRVLYWEKMKRLISLRSDKQIAKMEKEQGLS